MLKYLQDILHNPSILWRLTWQLLLYVGESKIICTIPCSWLYCWLGRLWKFTHI